MNTPIEPVTQKKPRQRRLEAALRTRSTTMVETSTQSVVRDEDGIPISFKLFSVGDNLDVRGGNAIYDPSLAADIMADLTRSDGTVPIDIAHGMVKSDAPAELHEQWGEGTLRCDDTGLWLDNITWRPVMLEKLKDRAFRFFSPTFFVNKEKHITGVLTVSLTNQPATLDAVPIVNDSNTLLTGMSAETTITDELEVKPTKKASKAKKSAPAIEEVAEMTIETREELAPAVDPIKSLEAAPADEGAEDEDEDSEGEPEELNLESIDLDSLNAEELRSVAEKLLDECMASRKALSEVKREVEVEDEALKRSIVNGLFKDCLIRYSDKAKLMSSKLKDIQSREAELRSVETTVVAPVVREKEIKSGPLTNSGVTDEDMIAWRTRNGFKDAEEIVREMLSRDSFNASVGQPQARKLGR